VSLQKPTRIGNCSAMLDNMKWTYTARGGYRLLRRGVHSSISNVTAARYQRDDGPAV